MPTIKQKSVLVETEDGHYITVRRMRWKSTRDFLRKLGAVVAAVYPREKLPEGATMGATLFARLPEIVAGSDELILLICAGSTDKTADEIDALDALTVSKIIGASLEINCDQETKNSWLVIAATLAGLTGTPKATTK